MFHRKLYYSLPLIVTFHLGCLYAKEVKDRLVAVGFDNSIVLFEPPHYSQMFWFRPRDLLSDLAILLPELLCTCHSSSVSKEERGTKILTFPPPWSAYL